MSKPRFQDNIGTIALLLIFGFVAFIELCFLAIDSLPSSGRKANIPELKFENVGPCLDTGQDIIERFEVGTHQYICGDMETSEYPVYLELHVLTIDKNKQVYVRNSTFSTKSISFIIDPPLPPGKYRAMITWVRGRHVFVDFEFEVIDKSND